LKQEVVPILSLSEKEKRFFETSFTWEPHSRNLHKQFHINKLEGVIEHMNFPLPPHRQTVNDFVFLTSGESIRSKGLDKYVFSSDTFFFLPAYQISTHELMSADAKGYYCHFDNEIFTCKWLKPDILAEFSFLQFTGNPLVTVEADSRKHLLTILEHLESEYSPDANYNLDVIRVNILSLLMEVKRFAKQEKVTENAALRIAQQYKNKLSRFIYEKSTVAEYASMLSISPNHLNKCVKAATGKSAQELLSEMVLLEARVLLRQTSLTVNEIAWKIGKEDPSDFIRFFKSKTGQTPTEYRKTE